MRDRTQEQDPHFRLVLLMTVTSEEGTHRKRTQRNNNENATHTA